MAKVSKNNIYAIKFLVKEGLSSEQISNELGLSLDTIQSIIESENLGPKPISSKDLMINKTSIKENKGVCIMTGAASMKNDEDKKKTGPSIKPSHIFNPLNQ